MIKIHLILIALIVLYSCENDEPQIIPKTNEFQINLVGKEPITFYNPECQFNNFDKYQAQFNAQSGNGYFMLSTYWNEYSLDSTLNQVWIVFNLIPNPPNIFNNLDSLPKYLTSNVTSMNDKNLRVDFQMSIDGIRYYNEIRDSDPNTFLWQQNDSLFYAVRDYEIFYHSECLDRELLYVKLQIEGKLYAYDYNFLTITDSITINNSNIDLLFAAD